MKFSIQYQINAILKHVNRNGLQVVNVEINKGYKGDFVSEEGECVFCYVSSCQYFTLASIASH